MMIDGSLHVCDVCALQKVITSLAQESTFQHLGNKRSNSKVERKYFSVYYRDSDFENWYRVNRAES